MKNTNVRKISWMLMLVMVFSLISPGTAWRVQAQEAYDGYVYVTIERSTLGQGLVVEPVKLGYHNGETASELIYNLFGKSNFVIDNTYGSDYVTGIVDGGQPEGWTATEVPAKISQAAGTITQRAKADTLASADYYEQSGWMYTVNDTSPDVGMSDYELDSSSNGIVIRMQFSVYGWGADLAGYRWGEPLEDFSDKLDLIRGMAEYSSDKKSSDYQDAVTVLSDWDATQEEVDAAADKLDADNKTSEQYQTAYEKAVDYIYSTTKEPVYGGEWAILSVARSNKEDIGYYKHYYDSVVAICKENGSGVFSTTKSTENSRVIIGMTAIGADATDVAGYNLLEPLADAEFVSKQGLNGAVYALIALDCGNYTIPSLIKEGKQTTREDLVKTVLDAKLENGGWTFYGENADADMTSMAIQALAPYYATNTEVKNAVDEAVEVLSSMQQSDGGFASWGTACSESCAQVLCALSILGIDVEEDSRFIKNGNSVLDALLAFQDETTGGFLHTNGGTVNAMASQQSAYALTAYSRFQNEENGLYVMTDAKPMYQCKDDAHVWDQGVVTVEATAETEGERTYTCTVCGSTQKESIEKIPAKEVEVQTTLKTPKKTSIKKVTSPKKKQIKVTWKKISSVTGYQIQVSTSAKFKKSVTKKYQVSGSRKTSKVIKSLKSKKKYYVRIRTYKTATVDGKKTTKYSGWSAKKTVKVK